MNVFDKLWKKPVIELPVEQETRVDKFLKNNSGINVFGEQRERWYVSNNIVKLENNAAEIRPAYVVPEQMVFGSVTDQCESFTGYNQACIIKGSNQTIRSTINKKGYGCSLKLFKGDYWEQDCWWEVTTKQIGLPVGHGPCTPL